MVLVVAHPLSPRWVPSMEEARLELLPYPCPQRFGLHRLQSVARSVIQGVLPSEGPG